MPARSTSAAQRAAWLRSSAVVSSGDRDAEWRDFGGGPVDSAGDARPLEAERQRQAADSGADDDDVSVAAAGRRGGHESL